MASHMLYVKWGRLRTTGVEEDEAICTFHFLSDEPWPGAAPENYETVEAALDSWWNNLKSNYSTHVKLAEYRWYREDDDTLPWGPPARVTTRAIAGTAVNSLPPQVALVVTEFVPFQEVESDRIVRHWGRFYLPAPATTTCAPDGSVTVGFQDAVMTWTSTLYDAFLDSGLHPIVRVTKFGDPPLPVMAHVQELRVDNVFDTQRRRKWETITRRRELPVPAS